jgi:hypothetical protein
MHLQGLMLKLSTGTSSTLALRVTEKGQQGFQSHKNKLYLDIVLVVLAAVHIGENAE